MVVGEFANQLSIDSVVFGLPLLYNKQLPDGMSGNNSNLHCRLSGTCNSPNPHSLDLVKILSK